MSQEDKDRMVGRYLKMMRKGESRVANEARKKQRLAREPDEGKRRPDDEYYDDYDEFGEEYAQSRPARARGRRSKESRKQALVEREESSLSEDESIGRVAAVHRTRVEVRLEETLEVVDLQTTPRALAEMVMGDRLILTTSPGRTVELRGRLPRVTELARRNPKRKAEARVQAVNVECGIITVAASAWNPGIVDRFLVLLWSGDMQARLCINKMDLVSEEERKRIEQDVRRFEAASVPAFYTSALEGQGVDTLRESIRGMTCVLVGHSGVGKSSLLNALLPEAEQLTGNVRGYDGKGRHTTTGSSLHPMEGGGFLVDTAGIRSIQAWDVSSLDLPRVFKDFAEFARECRFSNCSHRDEPECGVRAAVESGALAKERYEAYLRISASLEYEEE